MEKIAIILICYWQDEIVARALNHINIQTKRENVIIYLINNCSPYTNDEYQSLIQQYPDLNIKYYKTEENKGCGIARNIGLKHCTEKYIIFHDDDDWLHNEYIIENYLDIINDNIGYIKTNFIEQLDDEKQPVLAKDHNYLLGMLYNKDFLDKFNIRFNEKLLWRSEECLFSIQTTYYIKNSYYKELFLNKYSYVHYHSENFPSLTIDTVDPKRYIDPTVKTQINAVYDIILFAEELKFYSSIKLTRLEIEQSLNILRSFYLSAETILSLLERATIKANFTKEEINNFYYSVCYLIELVNKNWKFIADKVTYIIVNDNYQYINYYFFKETFEQRWKNLTKI